MDVRSSRLRTLVSLTKYLPHDGIGHAGGEYLQAHYRVLRERYDIVPIAPDTVLNRRALERTEHRPRRLVTSPSPLARDRMKVVADLQSAARGSAAHRWFERAIEKDADILRVIREADLIEFQWSEMASLAPRLRQLAPHAPQVIVAHDVITQRWRRAASHSRLGPRRLAYATAAWASARREALSFRTADAVIVFSDKDADLVGRLAPGAHARVVAPGFVVPSAPPVGLADRDPIVLFTGAMSRPDNDDAMRWFLRRCWPTIIRVVPKARLVIAGSRPSTELSAMAAAAPSVTLTGFVESLEPSFAAARVAVVPLRTGAGLKFKTVDALMRGIPVVTTTVGAEGIARDDVFACVSDDAATIAHAVADQLRQPAAALASSARDWAIGTYGFDAYRERLLSLYDEITAGDR